MKGKLLGLEKHKALATDKPQGSEIDTQLQKLLVDIDQYKRTMQTPPPIDGSFSSVGNLKLNPAYTWSEESVLESISALEHRISRLEKLIGGSVSNDSSESSVFPLESTLNRLEHRISLMDEECLDKIHTKSIALQREIEILNKDTAKSKELLTAAANVDGLRKKIDSVVSVADCLPDIVLRFKSLESIHQTAGNDNDGITHFLDYINISDDLYLMIIVILILYKGAMRIISI